MGHSLCVVVAACGHTALCAQAGAVGQVDRDFALVSAAGLTCSYIHIKSGCDQLLCCSLDGGLGILVTHCCVGEKQRIGVDSDQIKNSFMLVKVTLRSNVFLVLYGSHLQMCYVMCL